MKISTRRICGASIAALLAYAPVAACAQAIQYRDSDNINNVNVSVAQPLPVTVSGGGSNAAASATGSAVPASGSYNAVNVGGTLRGQTGSNPTGTTYSAHTDITSVGGTTALVGAGATGAGSPRTTQAQDTTTIAGAAPLTTGVYVTGPSAAALATAANQTTANSSLATIATAAQAGTTTTGSAAPASAVYMGANSGGNLTGIIQADASVKLDMSTATTTQLVALSSSKKIYITSWDVIAAGTGNIKLVYGTGSNCGTGTTDLTGNYNLTAQAGISKGSGLGPVVVVPASQALCATTSAAVQMSGSVAYTQF